MDIDFIVKISEKTRKGASGGEGREDGRKMRVQTIERWLQSGRSDHGSRQKRR